MKARFPRRVTVGLFILFLIHVAPASGAEVTQQAHIKGGQITGVRPRTKEAIPAGEPFSFTIQVTAVRARHASIREVTINCYLCVRSVSSGELVKTYTAGSTSLGRNDINTGDAEARFSAGSREYPPGEYEVIAFVMVNTDKASPIIVDIDSCRFRVEDR